MSNFAVEGNFCEGLKIGIKYPKVNNEVNNFLSLKQIENLDKDHNQTLANSLKLALFSGLRRSEILNLEWSRVDFENKIISLFSRA